MARRLNDLNACQSCGTYWCVFNADRDFRVDRGQDGGPPGGYLVVRCGAVGDADGQAPLRTSDRSLGAVARTKQTGLIPLVRPVLDELVRTARFWIGPELYQEVLHVLGETE